jgi:hypothetical protein
MKYRFAEVANCIKTVKAFLAGVVYSFILSPECVKRHINMFYCKTAVYRNRNVVIVVVIPAG